MGCMSCHQRAQLMLEGARNAIQGKSARPQVSQFVQTIRSDAATLQRMAAIKLGVVKKPR